MFDWLMGHVNIVAYFVAEINHLIQQVRIGVGRFGLGSSFASSDNSKTSLNVGIESVSYTHLTLPTIA